MDISEKIKLLRIRKNLSQQQLAALLGVGRNTITQYEAGRIAPPIHNLKKLANIFLVSVDFLLNDQLGMQEMDTPAILKTSFGNPYMDSIFSITAKKICEQFTAENEFYIDNKEIVYKLVEAILYLNIKAIKANAPELSLLSESGKPEIEALNRQIREFAKQLTQMERLQRLMEEK